MLPTAEGEATLVKPFTVTYGEPSTNGGVVAIRVQGEGGGGSPSGLPDRASCTFGQGHLRVACTFGQR